MNPAVTIRPIKDDEVEAFIRLKGQAYGYHPTPSGIKEWRDLNDLDRALAAFSDSGEIIGATCSYPLRMIVDGGGDVQVSGIAGVAVSPLFRRRGVMRALIENQLLSFKEQGDAAAVLWATDPSIYGRFGFKPYTSSTFVRLVEGKGVATGNHVLAYIQEDQALNVFEELSHSSKRSGELRGMRKLRARVFGSSSKDSQPFSVTATAKDGATKGLLVYRYLAEKTRGRGQSVVKIELLQAVDTEAEQSLWAMVSGLDLVKAWEFENVPTPLSVIDQFFKVEQVETTDGLWLLPLSDSLELSADSPHCSLIF